MTERSLHLAIVAGETSGDTHGAALMRSLRAERPDIRFTGKGGPAMAAVTDSGGRLDNWIAEAGVLGLWDVLRHYGYFKKKFDLFLKELAADPPDALILVDYPGFNLRLAKAVRKRGIPTRIIYYISPQVWAWNRRRIPGMARMLDLMICIFPFEKSLYEASGLPTVFAGHPMAGEFHPVPTRDRDPNLLGLFPGSRTREVVKIFPAMLGASALIHRSRPEILFEVAAATPAHAGLLREMISEQGVEMTVSTGASRDLMSRAAAALICSGTATLETALLGTPFAVVYRLNALTYQMARCIVKVPHFGLANVVAGREVAPELLQDEVNARRLGVELAQLLDPDVARHVRAELGEVRGHLGEPGAAGRVAEDLLGKL